MTETTASAVPIDRLGPWLTDNVAAARGPVRVDQLSGGSSNLTFRVRDDANDWVLRRPPLSHVLATAHDMGREYRVQLALAGTDVPVPRVVAHCEDDAAIGAPFYLMELLDGVVYTDADAVAHLTDVDARAASDDLVDVLAHLHAVDYAAVGLGDLGRPEGFVARQVQRWCKQWEKSKQGELPAVDEVAARLAGAVPARSRAAIVHGDYSFNNTMFEREQPGRMLALLDWEMSTLGDPLTDVGLLATYWGPVGALMWRSRSGQAHTANAGFPSLDVLLERYARTSGHDLDDIDFYRVLATFKLAVIVAGGAARQAATDPERARSAFEMTELLAAAALDLADTSSVPALRSR